MRWVVGAFASSGRVACRGPWCGHAVLDGRSGQPVPKGGFGRARVGKTRRAFPRLGVGRNGLDKRHKNWKRVHAMAGMLKGRRPRGSWGWRGRWRALWV